MTVNLRNHFIPNPPIMQDMSVEACPKFIENIEQLTKHNVAVATEEQEFRRSLCAKFDQLQENIKRIVENDANVVEEERQHRRILAGKFDRMERDIKHAVALMRFTQQFYPHVVDEFDTVQKAKKRIGVAETPIL